MTNSAPCVSCTTVFGFIDLWPAILAGTGATALVIADAGLVDVAVVTALTTLGTKLGGVITFVSGKLTTPWADPRRLRPVRHDGGVAPGAVALSVDAG